MFYDAPRVEPAPKGPLRQRSGALYRVMAPARAYVSAHLFTAPVDLFATDFYGRRGFLGFRGSILLLGDVNQWQVALLRLLHVCVVHSAQV